MLAICLTNRRDLYVHAALASLREHVTGYDDLIVVDDTGDDDWRSHLACIEQAKVIGVADHPAGYTSAMRRIWELASGHCAFLLEEDFTIDRPVDLHQLRRILERRPHLAQVALQRQPWFRREHQLGLIGAQRRRVNWERMKAGRATTMWVQRREHVEHDAGITCNPALWHPRAFDIAWPATEWSETAMGDLLLAHGLISAYFGQEGDQAHVTHHGAERAEHSAGY